MENNALTLTIVSNMTSNYSEGLGNISNVQKIFKNKKTYSMRSRESLKNSIMVQSGMYEDLKTVVNGATQKEASETLNVSNCRALEGGYMTTSNITYTRNSSFYLTDAISCESFINETRFHNNLYMADNFAKAKGLNVQVDAGKVGLMPYQYEYEKSLKTYSITIDLEMIGVDKNFNTEASNEEKSNRVISLLNAVKNLSLVVKGNLDNAEPIFVVGGLSCRKTHYFENVVKVKNENLLITKDLKDKINDGFKVALLEGGTFENESEIIKELSPTSISEFFNDLINQVREYYKVNI